jgi:hypothetical protein
MKRYNFFLKSALYVRCFNTFNYIVLLGYFKGYECPFSIQEESILIILAGLGVLTAKNGKNNCYNNFECTIAYMRYLLL